MGKYETKIIHDKQKDKIRKLECNLCLFETNHKILQSIDQTCEEILQDDRFGRFVGFYENYSWQIIQCMGCESVSFRSIYYNSEDDDFDEEVGAFIPIQRIEIYPKRLKRRKKLSNRNLIPLTVNQIYEETFDALCNHQWILSSIGIRTLVEAVCKEKGTARPKLIEQIDELVGMGSLSRTNADALQKLRIMGNKAAHEVKPQSELNLLFALDIIEHLLREVYILPNQTLSHFP